MSKKRFAFIKRVKESVTPIQQLPSVPVTISSNIYLSIYNLPLSIFEVCILNNNPSALIISGNPTEKQLDDAWNEIMAEYSEALGNHEYRMFLSLYKEVELLKVDFASINILVAALRKNYSQYFCDELNKILRQKCKFNVNDVTSYFAELDKCERRGKALKIQLDLKLLEFEAIKQKQSGESKEIDRNYFTSVLIILSKHNNYRITKDIFVNEYCEYVKQFTAHCEEMNRKK